MCTQPLAHGKGHTLISKSHAAAHLLSYYRYSEAKSAMTLKITTKQKREELKVLL